MEEENINHEKKSLMLGKTKCCLGKKITVHRAMFANLAQWSSNTVSLYQTKEARIYNGLKTISLTSGAGKTGQPLVKE